MYGKKDKGMIICANSFYEVRKAEFSRRDKQDERPHLPVPPPPPHCSDRQHLMTFLSVWLLTTPGASPALPACLLYKKNISSSAYVIYFLQVLLVIPDNSLSLWTSFLSLVSSRWDNDKVCLLDRAGSSLCTDVPAPSEKNWEKIPGGRRVASLQFCRISHRTWLPRR